MTHNTIEIEDYNYPSIEHNGEQWIRVVDHIALTNHQLQKAREEERERIEAVFKEHVPPHALDLEDSVWLKRLLNKAFNYDKTV